ncbi:peptidylprolyl isomerase [Candidatus Sororendozoicomonas aggregata]|uniref:peptidylprolyl isomerase n=1 Tax=Candidatus Sororendozoicomonas aggregata TaxID=3073239 RepID=UPI003B75B54C
MMKSSYSLLAGLVIALVVGVAHAQEAVKTKTLVPAKATTKSETFVQPKVSLETSMGTIVLALDPKKSPVTVDNFLKYVRDGYYNGLIFHRVIDGFMAQGGGMKPDMHPATPRGPIVNESANGLSNIRGSIAMARTSAPDSATSQFFINEKDNKFLDARPGQPGYAVFGHVVKGMDVVDAMAKVKTGRNGAYSDVPITPIVIKKAVIIEPAESKKSP